MSKYDFDFDDEFTQEDLACIEQNENKVISDNLIETNIDNSFLSQDHFSQEDDYLFLNTPEDIVLTKPNSSTAICPTSSAELLKTGESTEKNSSANVLIHQIGDDDDLFLNTPEDIVLSKPNSTAAACSSSSLNLFRNCETPGNNSATKRPIIQKEECNKRVCVAVDDFGLDDDLFSDDVLLSTPEPQAAIPQVQKRKFPGPAGLLPKLKDENSINLIGQDSSHLKMNADRPMQLLSQDSNKDFENPTWKTMLLELGLNESNPTSLINVFNIQWVLRRSHLRGSTAIKKVPFIAVIVKTFDTSNADVLLKDKTGEMNATISKKLIEDYSKFITAGTVLVLKDVTIISPLGIKSSVNAKNQYFLNITINSLISIYSTDNSLNVSKIQVNSMNNNEIKEYMNKLKTNQIERVIIEETELDIRNDLIQSESLFDVSFNSDSPKMNSKSNFTPNKYPQFNSSRSSPQFNNRFRPQVNSSSSSPQFYNNRFRPQVNSNRSNLQIDSNRSIPQVNNQSSPQFNCNKSSPLQNGNSIKPFHNSNTGTSNYKPVFTTPKQSGFKPPSLANNNYNGFKSNFNNYNAHGLANSNPNSSNSTNSNSQNLPNNKSNPIRNEKENAHKKFSKYSNISQGDEFDHLLGVDMDDLFGDF